MVRPWQKGTNDQCAWSGLNISGCVISVTSLQVDNARQDGSCDPSFQDLREQLAGDDW